MREGWKRIFIAYTGSCTAAGYFGRELAVAIR